MLQTMADQVGESLVVNSPEVNSLGSVKGQIIAVLVVEPVSIHKDCVRSRGEIHLKIKISVARCISFIKNLVPELT